MLIILEKKLGRLEFYVTVYIIFKKLNQNYKNLYFNRQLKKSKFISKNELLFKN